MSMGDKWATTPSSDAKLNKVTVVSGTGAYLASLTKSQHAILVCTSTGSGFTLDHVYLCTADGSSVIDISSVAQHFHDGTSTGGDVGRIFLDNPTYIDLLLTKTDDLKKAQWIETVTGTGSIEDSTDGTTGERSIRLRPNATSGSGATISYPHLQCDFSKVMLYQTKLRIETATSLALHTGIGADDITAADSNTRKLQAEVCTVTNNNWWLRTADGSANSASDSGVAITTNRVGIKIKHYVTLSQLLIDGGNLLEKSSNIPSTGASADINLIKHSIKNSTAADRPMHVYGSRLSYRISDEWF